uniref:Myb/SANT-like DNA-binding domain-containing protein n=1 Tax=Glossina austeni TaxID=7395 RepID=A0A1A9V1A2_GLOAU
MDGNSEEKETANASLEAEVTPAISTPVEQVKEYDDIALNQTHPEVEAVHDHDPKIKQRRYWTPKEEERFFEIWGRENWRLTKHGKNTIYFAQWAEELKDRFNIDVKLEEIQCKVNQTRAKFRQVKKQLEMDKNTIRWKKYDIVEKILKNQYRSKDDEPVPPEALENNRDMSPTELLNSNTRSTSPTSIASNSVQEQALNVTLNSEQNAGEDINMSNISLNENNLSMGLFNNDSQTLQATYSAELFSDQIDIKAEFEEDLRREELSNEYNTNSYNSVTFHNQETNSQQQPQQEEQTEAQFHQLQTAAEQQQQQQFQQQYLNQLQENQGAIPPQVYNNLTTNNGLNIPAPSSTITAASTTPTVHNHNHSLIDASITTTGSHNHITNHIMQPPRSTVVNSAAIATIATQPRKRNRTVHHNGPALSNDSLESLYMDEVRKKNAILMEQCEISRKRLQLEQRKVNLMEDFFPKYLDLQQQILQKLETVNNTNAGSFNIKIEN